MRKITKSLNRILLLLLLTLFAAVVFCSFAVIESSKGTDYFGLYTFNRELVLDNGKSIKFYESGDQYFRYYHDKEGFILIKENDRLFYARNDNGRPVPSNIRYGAGGLGVKNAPKMLAQEIDFSNNKDLLTEYPVEEDYKPETLLNSISSEQPRTIANVVIYIIFRDDNIDLTNNPAASLLGGSNPSLSDYFYRASDGGIVIENYFPINGNFVYVYRAPENRDYYNVEQTSTRGKREAVLLTSAVNTVSSRFRFNNANLDTNNDGYVDSVSFIIGGSSSSTWGSLLWPHSWNLASINKAYNNSASAKINEVKVGNYSFNFSTAINVGILCHEFFHVLGAPDLYHYDYDFVPVGDWDIMQFNKDVPQLPLTYMRTNYLGVSQDRVGLIEYNGVYSLTPTVTASPNNYLAYKIPTGVSGQYFMVEYRNNSVYPTYDSSLPDSGLIVYRIKEGVKEGNKNAKYQDTSYPDEVYVFRPKVTFTGRETNKDLRYSRSKTDIAYAALSPNNTNFNTIGASRESKPNVSYDFSTLFYVNGTNSGITVEALSITDGRLEFRVNLSSANSIPNDYFDDKITLNNAELVNAEYAGANVSFSIGEIQQTYLKNISVKLKAASGKVLAENNLNLSKFRTRYESGERQFQSRFVINDKGFPANGIFDAGNIDTSEEPAIAELSVTDGDNDTKVLQSIVIAKSVSWQEVLATKTQLNASISASPRITLGVRKDGSVEKSGGYTDGQWAVDGYNNIILASAGFSHTLLLTMQRKVISVGSNDLGESNTSNWQDIKLIEGGYRTSYAVNLQGRVYAVGDNSYGQLNINSWTNITSISAGVRHVAGVDNTGKVYAEGANTDGQLDILGISNAKAVACGATFSAFLLKDGRVTIAGTLIGKEEVESWQDIVKIAAGENFIIGLKQDKTVVAAGVNDAGQCSVAHLEDIIDIAGGENHAAFLREDGTVLFTGGSHNGYNVNSGIGNLIYDNYIFAKDIDFSISRTTLYTGIQNEMAFALCNSVVNPFSATYKKVSYTSSNTKVATVSASGTVVAVGSGAAIITAKVNGTNISKEIAVTVKEYVELISIAFADPITTVIAGNSASLMLVYKPTNATVYGKITYTITGNTNLATIDNNGTVIAGNNGFGEVTVAAFINQGDFMYRADCIIKIVSSVKSIEVITLPTKTTYLYNEDFDISGGRIRITYWDNSTAEQSVTQLMISGYDKTELGIQTIKIKYMESEISFQITVQNYIKDAVLLSVGKTEYIYNESLDLKNITILQKWADGNNTTAQLPTHAAASGYDKTKVGIQQVTLTFTLNNKVYNAEYTVTVQDVVRNISSEALTKKTYLIGEELLDTESILLYMESGAQRTVELKDTVITGYDPYLSGLHKVKIEYLDKISGQKHYIYEYFTVELNGQINVYSVDELGDRHLYMPPEHIYFIVGKDLPIDLVFSLADGRQLEINTNNQDNIYYIIESFNNLNSGSGYALIRVEYKRNKAVAGGEITTVTEHRYIELHVFGEAEIDKIEANGKAEYLYGEMPDFYVYTVDISGNEGGGKADKVVYDPELTGEFQTCLVYYRNSVLRKTIIIYDYIVSLVPIDDITAVYGENIDLKVHGIMAKLGKRQLLQEEYQVMGLNTLSLGERTVTVNCGQLSLSFILKVVDAIVSVQVNTPITDTCLFGQIPSFWSTYNVNMASGESKVIEFNTNEFTVSNFDSRLLAAQTVRVTHKQTSTVFNFTITVVDYEKSISVASGAKTVYRYGEELSLSINATMATGLVKTVALSNCIVTGYNSRRIATQTVIITYAGISTTIEVSVQDTVIFIRLDRTPYKTTYQYGEAISFLGGILTIGFSSGDNQLLRDSAISSVACSYNPVLTGKQTVNLELSNQTVSFNVNVANKQSDTYKLNQNQNFVQKEKSIIFNKTITAKELKENLTIGSYLSARIKKANGELISLSDLESNILRSDYILQIVNAAGYIVFSYNLYLAGDADCNGILDENDISKLAERLVSQDYERDMTDYNGDGMFSLTDLVSWARKIIPPVSPINSIANGFISDVAPKKKEDRYE